MEVGENPQGRQVDDGTDNEAETEDHERAQTEPLAGEEAAEITEEPGVKESGCHRFTLRKINAFSM